MASSNQGVRICLETLITVTVKGTDPTIFVQVPIKVLLRFSKEC